MGKPLRAGFIGLGNQGGPIALRQIQQGVALGVWARRPESLTDFVAAGAAAYPTPAALAADHDLVGVCVINDKDVDEVVLGENGVLAGMKPGGIIAIHATVPPDSVIELEKAVKAAGVHLLDAPVSGGPAGARAGTMTVMIGGEAEVLARARPVLETWASKIPHLGAVGTAQMMKLLNNNLCYANAVMSVDALELAGRLGMDVDRAAEVMGYSSGASHGLGIVTSPATLAKATGPSSNITKDVACFVDVLRKAGIGETPLTTASSTTVDRMTAYAAKRPG